MLDSLEEELKGIKKKLRVSEKECDELEENCVLQLNNIRDDDDKGRFYTGFLLYSRTLNGMLQLSRSICTYAELLVW